MGPGFLLVEALELGIDVAARFPRGSPAGRSPTKPNEPSFVT